MENLSTIVELLEKRQFGDVEKLLTPLYRNNYNDTKVNYLFGLFYKNSNNPKHSKDEAVRHFRKAIQQDDPVEEAFYELAIMEQHREKSVRILKQGLTYFPSSESLYVLLFYRTDIEDREELYKETLGKKIESFKIQCIMIESRFENKDYDGTLALIGGKKTYSVEFNLLLRLLEGLCLLEKEEATKQPEDIFKQLVEDDVGYFLQHMAHFAIVRYYFKVGSIENACKYFNEIPLDTSIDPFVMSHGLGIGLLELILQVLTDIENMVSDKLVVAKARGTRGLYFYYHQSETTTQVSRDLEFSIRYFSANIYLNENLINLYTEKRQFDKAYQTAVKFTTENYNSLDESCLSFIDDMDLDSIIEIVNDIKRRLQDAPSQITKTFYNPFIERLHKEKKYDLICLLADAVHRDYLFKTNVIFEIAYAYYEKKRPEAKLYYQRLRNTNNSNAVSNNLALIYEKEGDFETAEELFLDALNFEKDDKTATSNLKRVREKIAEDKKVINDFLKENLYIQGKLLNFSKHRNANGYIICPYRQLPEMLGLSTSKVTDVLNSFLKKKYLEKVSNHGLDTNSSVYQINSAVLKQVDTIADNLKNESELFSIAEKLSIQNLENLGYNKQLFVSIQKVSSQELQEMLLRDLREAAVALLSGSYKSSLLLSGSLVEAILLDKIKTHGIHDYKMEDGKTKKVDRMDLSDLLYVANQEKLIDNQLYHLSHAIRGYRNIIHPGVEVRKQSVVVDENNARMAWDIARKVIMEV